MTRRYLDVLAGLLMLLIVAILADRGVATIHEEGLAQRAALSHKAETFSETVPSSPAAFAEGPRVVLDSGHGGSDPGKVGVNQALEKDINLAIAEKLKTRLEEAGITVIMTRESDTGLYRESDSNKKVADLAERCRRINESGAQIAVSIHQTSYHDGGVFGSQMFYYKTSAEGRRLAEALHDALAQLPDHRTRPVKENDNYYLLLHAACPVVIAECGFLSNWNEAELLATEDYQNALADALCEGIRNYLEK